ncbi:MAG TPA: hypothetical protein VH593_17615 [Ktedonobacteraceae bacterium]|jgi:transposase
MIRSTPKIIPFSSKRVERGLYRASTGRRIHADVNGYYNTLRKAVPNSVWQGIEAVAVRPVLVDVNVVSPARGAGSSITRTNQSIAGY